MKKLWSFLSSMRFALILLTVLALACAGGSLIPQGLSLSQYAADYSERTAALILALGLDDVFHSWWFLLITAFLCCNLLLCSLLRLRTLLAQTRRAQLAEPETAASVKAAVDGDPEAIFARLRFPQPKRTTAEDGREALVCAKNTVGLWGAWICHLGILLLIVGFALGQMTHREFTVYGVPGQTRAIGDTGLQLTIDVFEVALREDGSAEQYRTALTVSDGAQTRSGTAEVNAPADLFGLRFYQNSTGWAASVTVEKDGEPLQEELLCVGEFFPIQDRPQLVVLFRAFYPDYVYLPGTGPATASNRLNAPAYLYALYYNEELLGMNVLTGDEQITVDDYTIVFRDPQHYTLLQVKQDRFTPLALAGGLIVLLGLFLSFYLQPKKLWALRTEEGWTLCGICRKGAPLFREQFFAACGKEDPHASD